ncbi:MAG: FkbM family methyltransferase [Candidatus Omnitrophota bacterium]
MRKLALPWGMEIKVDVREAVGLSLWYRCIFELEVSEVLWRLIKPGDLVIDVGANVGYMTSIMASRCGTTGTVLAFEPHQFVFSVLKDNVQLFKQNKKAGKITIFNAALSNARKEQRLVSFNEDDILKSWGTSYLSDDQSQGIPAMTTTLDEIVSKQSVSLVKIDVEGHELRVLEGAQNLLRQKMIKNIVYENLVGAGDSVHKYLEGFGYTIFYISWGIKGVKLIPLKTLEALNPGAPNYLASLESSFSVPEFKQWGWQCLVC